MFVIPGKKKIWFSCVCRSLFGFLSWKWKWKPGSPAPHPTSNITDKMLFSLLLNFTIKVKIIFYSRTWYLRNKVGETSLLVTLFYALHFNQHISPTCFNLSFLANAASSYRGFVCVSVVSQLASKHSYEVNQTLGHVSLSYVHWVSGLNIKQRLNLPFPDSPLSYTILQLVG